MGKTRFSKACSEWIISHLLLHTVCLLQNIGIAKCHKLCFESRLMMMTNRKYCEPDECALGVEIVNLFWLHLTVLVLADPIRQCEISYIRSPIHPTKYDHSKTSTKLGLSSTWKKRNICPKRPRYGKSSENTPLAMLPLTHSQVTVTRHFTKLLMRASLLVLVC